MTPAIGGSHPALNPAPVLRETLPLRAEGGERLLPLLHAPAGTKLDLVVDHLIADGDNGYGWWTDGVMAVGLPGVNVREPSRPHVKLFDRFASPASAVVIDRATLDGFLPSLGPAGCTTCEGSGEQACQVCFGDREHECTCGDPHTCGTCEGNGSTRCEACGSIPWRQPRATEKRVIVAGGRRSGFDGRLLAHGLRVFGAAPLRLWFDESSALMLAADSGERMAVMPLNLEGYTAQVLDLDARVTA